jgi:histidinol-phosphatase (PHP family)
MIAAVHASDLYGAVFTEHVPLPEHYDPDRRVSMRPADLPVYIDTLRQARVRTAVPHLVIGAEADWLSEDPAWTTAAVSDCRAAGIEVVLGSVHMLDGWAFDDPNRVCQWEQRGVEAVWELYFAEWCRAVTSGLFDVMAHPDLVKKFGHLPADPRSFYSEAARVAGQAGVLCEVSTAGLRRPCAELYPAPFFIAELLRAGVEFTLASDAHARGEVGYQFDYARGLLETLGVKRLAFPRGRGEIEWLSLQ